ncbi:MAG: zinc ribbon domain-containing protein [Anaerolineales bacterium]|nr:zinc ribbon domain-containing protein [Anaerolineales bacterium]
MSANHVALSASVGSSSIAQEYVGELTGSITGQVHCFGYAIDQGVCVSRNFGGPRMAVEAIRARLSKGETVNCVPWKGTAVELTPGEGNTGKYRDFMQTIPKARYTSVILRHERVTSPDYDGKSRTCILRTDEAQGVAMLRHHITRLVNVPVFDAWAAYLWDAGTRANLVSYPVLAGGIDLWAVVYTGRASHSDTQYTGGLGQGRKSSRHTKEWFDGKHQAIITDENFEQCQTVRGKLAHHRKSTRKMRTFILHDRVFCAHCTANKPATLVDDNYGKMRPSHHKNKGKSYYRCLSGERGYEKCPQPHIDEELLDDQVAEILSSMTIPDGLRDRVEQAVQSRLENAASLARMAEIQQIIERIDFRWEHGFIDKAEYLEKRQQLQREVESLRPVDFDDLVEAADLLEHFPAYWDQCREVDDPARARQQLVAKIIERVCGR